MQAWLGQPYQAAKGKRNPEAGGCKISLSILGKAMPNSKENLCSREALVLFQNAKEVGIRFLSAIAPFPLFPADETSSTILNRCKHSQRLVDLGQYAMKIAASLA